MALTILLADDSMTAQNMGKKILTEAGFEVIAVSNGAAAVKKIAERRPDLAVLDVYMPGYTGLEVCERLKSAHETTNLPVLLTVGKMEPFKPEEGTRVKADGLIIKPFEASDLLAAIHKLQEKLSPKATVVATAHDPDELPEYERTVKIAAPVFDEKDESYASWKSGAVEHVDENLPASVPSEMQASAAFAGELDAVRPDAGTRSTEAIDPPVLSGAEAPTAELAPAEELADSAPQAGLLSKAASSSFGGAMIDDDFAKPAALRDPATETVRINDQISSSAGYSGFEVAPSLEEHSDAVEKIQAYGAAASFEDAAAAVSATSDIGFQPSSGAEFEPTSAPQFDSEPEAAPALGFEPTSLQSGEEVEAHATDPALVTDGSGMASAFPTKFGVENAEVVPVGNASDYPELYGAPASAAGPIESSAGTELEEYPAAIEAPAPETGTPVAEHTDESSDAEFEARVNAALKTAWAAEEMRLEEHEHGVVLHEEMQQQFAKTISAIEPEPTQKVEPLPEAVAEAAGAPAVLGQAENAPDHQLAAAMAAAVGAHMEPAIADAISQGATSSADVGESTMPLDQHTALIAEVVHRVTERIKPELIAQISREVAEEMARKKK